jgi:hypothetical protein
MGGVDAVAPSLTRHSSPFVLTIGRVLAQLATSSWEHDGSEMVPPDKLEIRSAVSAASLCKSACHTLAKSASMHTDPVPAHEAVHVVLPEGCSNHP